MFDSCYTKNRGNSRSKGSWPGNFCFPRCATSLFSAFQAGHVCFLASGCSVSRRSRVTLDLDRSVPRFPENRALSWAPWAPCHTVQPCPRVVISPQSPSAPGHPMSTYFGFLFSWRRNNAVSNDCCLFSLHRKARVPFDSS